MKPVAGLDPYVTRRILRTCGGLNREGITIIMISHDIPAAKKYATHILHVKDEPSYMTKDDYFKRGHGADFSIVRDGGDC